MLWKEPPKIKIYEALGAVADGRVTVDGGTGKVFSSSGNKAYEVKYDPSENAITSNDNASYWKGYLGYPAIAYLLAAGKLAYDRRIAEALKGIAWKDINVKFKNDFDKTLKHIHDDLEQKGISIADLENEVGSLLEQVKGLKLKKLGATAKPPEGY